MIKRLIIVATAALLLVSIGCGDMLNAEKAKARDLGEVVEQNLKTSAEFSEFIVSFEWTGEMGQYHCVTRGLPDGRRTGVFAWNAMSVLDERNNTLVQTGRSEFTITGEQDGAEIFEVEIVAGSPPVVTLKGPWAGETWEFDSGE